MINKNVKFIRTISFVSMILTGLWVILMIFSTNKIKSAWNDYDYINWISNPDLFFYLSYINVTVLTLSIILFFSALYFYFDKLHSVLPLYGLILVPVYGIINIVCYSIQFTVLPNLAVKALMSRENIFFVNQLIQAESGTIVSYLNGLAYAILGIPSMIFGFLMFKDKKRFSGIFLFINGVSCIAGIIGYVIKNKLLSSGILIGGVVFMLGLLFIILEFRNNK